MNSHNIFSNNVAPYGQNLASYAIRLALTIYSVNNMTVIYSSKTQNSSIYHMKNQNPGIYLKFLLKFEALDHYNQTTTFMQNE